MKTFLIAVLLTLVATLGFGWYTDMTVRQGVAQLAERAGVPIQGLTGTTGPVDVPDEEAMIAAADALDAQFVAAFNAGDADALAALYWTGPDVVSYPPDAMQARGVDAIRTGTAVSFETMPGATLELTESRHLVVGDAVVGHGTFRMTLTGPDGEPTEILGRFTDVKAERDGRWVYLLDHASVPLPPMPDEGS